MRAATARRTDRAMEVGPTYKLYGIGNGPSMAGNLFDSVILECDVCYQWLAASDIGIDHRAGIVYRRKQKARSSDLCKIVGI